MPRINHRTNKRGFNFNSKSTRKVKSKNDKRAVSESPKLRSSSASKIVTRSNSNIPKNAFEPSSIHANARCKTQSTKQPSKEQFQYNLYRRVCYCDRGEQPKDCKLCSQDVTCSNHELVNCVGAGCKKMFHRECIEVLSDRAIAADDYKCCECNFIPSQCDKPWDKLSLATKADRMGLLTPINMMSNAPRNEPDISDKVIRKIGKDINSLKSTLDNINIPDNVKCKVVGSDPQPYPSITEMSDSSLRRHVIHGRRFEVSMLLFQVQKCSSCGRVEPIHIDPLFPTESIPFKRTHFNKNFHPAFMCDCREVCHGEQYYSYHRPSQKDWYNQHHIGRHFPTKITQCKHLLCNACYNECAGKDHVYRLRYGRMFSFRNGFGPMSYTTYSTGLTHSVEDMNYLRSNELQRLLLSFTVIEEAAIRTIVPLLSIIRLMHGNIKTKGNTSCVWQKSKLCLILPNLPSECKYIIINRRNRNGTKGKSNLVSTKFERRKIQYALELLLQTVPGVWKNDDRFPQYRIEVSEEKLNQWPVSGDFTDLDNVPTVYECDKDGSEIVLENPQNVYKESIQKSKEYDKLYRDGNDLGPAPLQNSVAPLETFESVIDLSSKNKAAGANAQHAFKTLENHINELKGIDVPMKVNMEKEQVELNQDDVYQTGDFADMDNTPFAWARAFPTVFIPQYRNGRWIILHDITGCFDMDGVRDTTVDFNNWMNFMMFRSDGIPASHPTFSLVTHNHKMKKQLQGQGRHVLNTSNMDPNLTAEKLVEMWDDKKSGRQELFNRLHTHCSNIGSTKSYWLAQRFAFKSTVFYRSYIKDEELSYFHTGSVAEFHEPWLRLIIYQYLCQLDNPTIKESDVESILSDDSIFLKYVQKFKNIVTLYVAVKMEIWMALFMKPVHGITGGLLCYQFAPSRGAIHWHCNLYSEYNYLGENTVKNGADEAIAMSMKAFNDGVCNLMERFYQHVFDIDPRHKVDLLKEENSVTRWDQCKTICRNNDQFHRTNYFSTYENELLILQNNLNQSIKNVMQYEWGYDAIHIGTFPQHWVKPGGLEEMDYRKTSNAMLRSDDVLATNELKFLKCMREDELISRRINITNHTETHRCSNYCKRVEKITVDYNEKEHKDKADKVFQDQNGKPKIVLERPYCRMNFGYFLRYDNSGENNFTRGRERVVHPYVEFDDNGQPRYFGIRNHPRILQEPHSFHYYGANNDLQKFLIGKKEDPDVLCNIDLLSNKLSHLSAAGAIGVDRYCGSSLAVDYTVNYFTLGGMNSEAWNQSCLSLAKAFCDKEEQKSLRSVVAKSMYEVTKEMSVPRDETIYKLCGGKLVCTSDESTSKFSVNEREVVGIKKKNGADISDEINTDDADAKVDDDNSFTWQRICKRYMSRDKQSENMNLYKFIVYKWKSRALTIPQFMGYDNKVSWPLKEEYSKWQLTFFKPWRKSVDELKLNGSYSNALMGYLTNEEFPISTRYQILKRKIKAAHFRDGDSTSLEQFQAGDIVITPTAEEDRTDLNLQDAIKDANNNADINDNAEIEYNIPLEKLNCLLKSHPTHVWNINYDVHFRTWLDETKDKYYKDIANKIAERDMRSKHGDVKLLDEQTHRPENCKGFAQTFTIFLHIYQHFLWDKYEEDKKANVDIDPPPSVYVKVQGKPGTGKTFVTKTLQNITRNIFQSNDRDGGSAPTGCAASLFGGKTHHRSYCMPTGRKLNQVPSNMTTKNDSQILSWKKIWSAYFTYIMDEDSMSPTQFWAWFEHRSSEARGQSSVLCAEYGKVVHEEMSDLCESIRNRDWGGIPIIYSMGDIFQLPAIGPSVMDMKSIGKPNTSDMIGKMVFRNFLDPKDSSQAFGVTVIMDQVFRQENDSFLTFLDNVRYGTLSEEEIKFIRSRCLEHFSTEHKQKIEQSSIHLCPTWQMTLDITFNYLRSFNNPVAVIAPRLGSSKKTNCCIKEKSYPMLTAYTKGAKVMLLKNYIVELGLMNGSVGTVVDIVYEEAEGPRNQSNLPAYVIVDIPKCMFPAVGIGYTEQAPKTHVPIPITKEFCERKCCTIETIPLRVCKAITIHKGQGITVGLNHDWENVVIYFVEGKKRSQPGLELVALSRVEDPNCLFVGNNSFSLTNEQLSNIGRGLAYDKRKEYESMLRDKSIISQKPFVDAIMSLDNSNGANEKTFEGGCRFLCDWYRSKCADNTSHESFEFKEVTMPNFKQIQDSQSLPKDENTVVSQKSKVTHVVTPACVEKSHKSILNDVCKDLSQEFKDDWLYESTIQHDSHKIIPTNLCSDVDIQFMDMSSSNRSKVKKANTVSTNLVTPSPKRIRKRSSFYEYFDAVDNYDVTLFPPQITPQMKQYLKSFTNTVEPGHNDQIPIDYHSPTEGFTRGYVQYRMLWKDLKSVYIDNELLNDTIIDTFFSVLKIRNDGQTSGLQCVYYSTNIFNYMIRYNEANDGSKFLNIDYPNVTVAADAFGNIFEKDCLFLPINQCLESHWVLIVVSMRDKTIQFLCSLHKDGTRYLNLMYGYLQYKWNQYYSQCENLKHQFDTFGNKPWTFINSKPDVPHQNNTHNCGVYLCLFVDVISNGYDYQCLISNVVNKRGRMYVMSQLVDNFGHTI